MNGGHEGKRRLWSNKKDLGVEGSPGVINPCISTEGKLCYERSDELQHKGVENRLGQAFFYTFAKS